MSECHVYVCLCTLTTEEMQNEVLTKQKARHNERMKDDAGRGGIKIK